MKVILANPETGSLLELSFRGVCVRLAFSALVVSALFGHGVGMVLAQQGPQRMGVDTALSREARALQGTLAMPSELRCIGFISKSFLPMDMYISGTEYEGITTFAMEGAIVYLNGPGLTSAKVGQTLRVVRAEGKVSDPFTSEPIGIYYSELGTVRMDAMRKDGATATVITSCNIMFKGDVVLPLVEKPTVKGPKEVSNRLTPYPEDGLASYIILGKEDITYMSAGQFCFIGAGTQDGVKLGDRFTIYRAQPPFDAKDLIVNRAAGGTSYKQVQTGKYLSTFIQTLKNRKIPPRVLGDLVILDVGENTAVTKIIYSRAEIHIGDIVVRR